MLSTSLETPKIQLRLCQVTIIAPCQQGSTVSRHVQQQLGCEQSYACWPYPWWMKSRRMLCRSLCRRYAAAVGPLGLPSPDLLPATEEVSQQQQGMQNSCAKLMAEPGWNRWLIRGLHRQSHKDMMPIRSLRCNQQRTV